MRRRNGALSASSAGLIALLLTFGLWSAPAYAQRSPGLPALDLSPPVPGSSQVMSLPTQPVLPSNAMTAPLQSRPVPPPSMQSPAQPYSPFPPVDPSLSAITQLRFIEGEFHIIAPKGSLLLVKDHFTLEAPNRLVIDIAHARLLEKSVTIPAGRIGSMPFSVIRLGQFNEDTVRVVVETPDPERFQVSLARGADYDLRVFAPHRSNIAFRFVNRILGNTPRPQPQIASANGVMGARPDVPPRSGGPIMYQATPLQRLRIVDIARSQLGVNKGQNPDYVNSVYSRGKDQAWCADFVSTILEWAGGSPWGHTALVKDIYVWGQANGRLRPFPEPGDIAIFRFTASGFDHTAIVESINPDSTITTIGGNEGQSQGIKKGWVQRTSYPLADNRILGYVSPF